MMAPTFQSTTITRWSSADAADSFAVEDPATGAVITTVQGGGAAEVDTAVCAADAAFRSWRRRSLRERGAMLLACADHLDKHLDELAALESLENGKPISQARLLDLPFLVGAFRYFGSLVDKLPSEFHDQGAVYASVVLEPLGVVGGIIPFNWPPIHTGAKVAPALAMGNTVVLKPGEQAPLTIIRIVELLNEILPPDVLHVVPGTGVAAGQALAAHPLVRKLSFTGSTRAGAAVMRTAADNITPVLLELGGKNAFIVFDDADLDQAVRDALDGGYFNQGEACTAASRLLVQRGVYDAFVDKLAAGVRRLRVGDGADAATHVGPLVTRAHQQRVLEYIALGETEGAVVAARGMLPHDPRLREGFFVAPVLFRDVTPDMTIAVEEIFGPVAVAIPFDTAEQAVQIANSSEYGLVAGVYTRDMTQGLRISRELDAGIVFINNYYRMFLGTPFGGVKHSGMGREHCIQTLHEFAQPKSIRFPSGMAPIPAWIGVTDIFGAEGSEA